MQFVRGRKLALSLAGIGLLVFLVAAAGQMYPQGTQGTRAVQALSTPSTTPTQKPTATPTPTPSDTATARPTATPTPSATPSVTPTPSPEPTPGLIAQRDMGYVPILMYHYVRTVDPEQDELGYNLSVTPELFEEQMQWLSENGYTPVRMDTLANCLRGLERCPSKPIALTFDDGYADAATTAFPILQRYGFTGTFYIVTEFVGRPGYMTWEQIKLLHESGMEIGSHTMSHPDLTARDPEVAYREVVSSRAIIAKRIQEPVRSFCYPLGQYTPLIASLVRDAGYTNGVTTYPGSSLEQLYELPRRRMLGGESIEALAWYLSEPAIE